MVGSLDGRPINVSDGLLDALLYLSCTKAVTLEVFPIHKIDRYPNQIAILKSAIISMVLKIKH